MSMLAVIDYSLIVLFFIVLVGLVLLIAQPEPPEVAQTERPLAHTRQDMLACGLLVLIFVLLIAFTCFTRKEYPSIASASQRVTNKGSER